MAGTRWIKAWLKSLTGTAPITNPWEDDPKIRAERRSQHERINATTRWELERQRRERRIQTTEDIWRREHEH
jgi:hypothetical protein